LVSVHYDDDVSTTIESDNTHLYATTRTRNRHRDMIGQLLDRFRHCRNDRGVG
jgi:hypothetical protein